MKKVNVHDAKTNFSAILAELEKTGERFVICRNGSPVADLTPHKRVDRMKSHPRLGAIRIDYDPTEELTTEEWPEEAR